MKVAHLLILTTAVSSGLAYGQMSGMSMASPASNATSTELIEGEASQSISTPAS